MSQSREHENSEPQIEFDKESVLQRSPLLRTFLMKDDDFKAWNSSVIEQYAPYFKEFQSNVSDAWAVVTSPLLYDGYFENIFNSEFYASSQGNDYLRLISAQLIFIGYELAEPQNINHFTTEVTQRFSALPYIREDLKNNPTPAVEKFIKKCMFTGADIHLHYYKDSSHLRADDINWDPGPWSGVIEGLDLTGFTGERPE